MKRIVLGILLTLGCASFAVADTSRCTIIQNSLKKLREKFATADKSLKTAYRLRDGVRRSNAARERALMGSVEKATAALERNGIQFGYSIGKLWDDIRGTCLGFAPDAAGKVRVLPPLPDGVTVVHDSVRPDVRSWTFALDIEGAKSDDALFEIIKDHFYAAKGEMKPVGAVSSAKYDAARSAYIAATRRKIASLRQQLLSTIVELRIQSTLCGDESMGCTPQDKAKLDRLNKRVLQGENVAAAFKGSIDKLVAEGRANFCTKLE